MSKQVKLRRGTTAEMSAFTGALGELTYDEERKQPVLHDGETQGGQRVAVERLPDLIAAGVDQTGAQDATPIVDANLATGGKLQLPSGKLLFDSSRIFRNIAPVFVEGNGCATTIHVGDNNVHNTAFRLEAIGGGNFGRPAREITQFENMSFTGNNKTAIDAQAVFPLVLKSVRLEHMGKAALKLFQCYYGRFSDMYFIGSGVDFNNVNNITISGGDAQYDKNNTILTATDYGFNLVNCDRITFDDMTFESWSNSRVLYIEDGKNINLNDVWFEGCTHDHLIKLVDTVDLNIRGGWLELGPSPSDAFIVVENRDSTGTLEGRVFTTTVNIINNECRLTTHITGDTEYRFIKAPTGDDVTVNWRDSTIRVGYLRVDPSVTCHLSGITCPAAGETTDDYLFLESAAVASRTIEQRNTWVPESAMPDWDFAAQGWNQEGGTDITFATVDKATEPDNVFTGTKAIKCTVPADPTSKTIKFSSQVGAIVGDPGTTYIAFLRIKTSVSVDMSIGIDGTIINCIDSKVIQTKDGEWTDYFIKASTAVAQNAGQHGNPKLFMKVRNATGNPVDIYIDRGDMQKSKGNVYLP